MEDRDKVIEMLAKVRDNFSLNTYKKVYQITDKEIEEKQKALEGQGRDKTLIRGERGGWMPYPRHEAQG